MTVTRHLITQCDAHTLNLLVRPTVAMLRTLLESNNATFHIMATDTVSYNQHTGLVMLAVLVEPWGGDLGR